MRVFFLLLAPLLAVAAWSLETQLLSRAELLRRVPMTQLSDFKKIPLLVRTPDFVLTSGKEAVPFSLRGRDKRGRAWLVRLRDASIGAWRSETNGRRIYYFAGYTGATGMGPATWILALSFDQVSRPVPFFVRTHGGIEDVLDLDGTGPELLVQDYQGNIRDDPGYYVTTLYQQRGPFWYRSDGRHGAHVFPTSERWSVMWKGQPAVLTTPPVFKRAARDWSDDPATGIKTAITNVGQYGTFDVQPESGCGAVSPGVIVWDTHGGRSIEMEGFEQTLDTLAKAHARVVLTGVYHWSGTDCDAGIAWATTERQTAFGILVGRVPDQRAALAAPRTKAPRIRYALEGVSERVPHFPFQHAFLFSRNAEIPSCASSAIAFCDMTSFA